MVHSSFLDHLTEGHSHNSKCPIHKISNKVMNKTSFSELSFIALFLFTMPGLGRPLSPWWTHFHMVDGDFRVVQCLHCNKLVRRGKAGCSTREASNSGMAKHMKTRHADQATQVVLYILKAYSLFNLIPTGSAGNWFCQGGEGGCHWWEGWNGKGISSPIQAEVQGRQGEVAKVGNACTLSWNILLCANLCCMQAFPVAQQCQ